MVGRLTPSCHRHEGNPEPGIRVASIKAWRLVSILEWIQSPSLHYMVARWVGFLVVNAYLRQVSGFYCVPFFFSGVILFLRGARRGGRGWKVRLRARSKSVVSMLFAVCFRWGLGAFLFLSSHVEILTSHDARYTAVAHLPPARLGGVSSLDPLGSAASRLAPLPLRQPPLLPAPPLLVSCLAAPLAPGHQSSCESLALHTLTTQQLRRESVKVKILLCRPSRHSSCVVRV